MEVIEKNEKRESLGGGGGGGGVGLGGGGGGVRIDVNGEVKLL